MSLLASLLSFFYDLVPSYAVAIAFLTITVMIVLLPLTLKGTRSMLAMQRLQPDIKKLQEKHKNDRQKLNEELMALYRDNKISPLSGCLPLLLQIPVFLILYRVISGLTHHNAAGQPAPKYLKHSSEIFHDLVASGGKMKSFGIDLSQAATSHHASIAAALPFFGLVAAMVAVQYWQQRQLISKSPQADTPQAQQMRTMQKFFPPIFGVISLSIPAGVVVYWVISSLFRVFQQWAMYRFDPILKSQVESAHQEARRFLAEGNGGRGGRGSRTSKSSSKKKKRKGR